ncbi:MAG: hypothetical protein WBX09_08770, partial [Terracidiphilus sp.]
SGADLASGDAGLGTSPIIGSVEPSQMAGPTLAVGVVGGIEVLSSATGKPMATIVAPGYTSSTPEQGTASQSDFWWLASDGSYIAVAGGGALSVFSPGGQLLCSRSGKYFADINALSYGTIPIFAAPGQVEIANGPAGANTVETVAVPSCASTVSAPYQGQFETWFTDGSQFITQASGTVWVYSSTGTLKSTEQIPMLGGTGNWTWTFGQNSSNVDALTIYPAGSTTPALTVSGAGVAGYLVSGKTIAVLDGNTFPVIDLSGSTPVEKDYTFAYLATAFAAISSSKWVAASGVGPLLDGASLATGTPRYLGRGAVEAIVGSTANVVIATANGQIANFDPSNKTPLGSISLASQALALSTDGSVLAASSPDGTLLNIYSLPSGTLSDSLTFPAANPGITTTGPIASYTLAGSGNNLGIVTDGSAANGYPIYTPEVLPVSGSPIIWSGSPVTVDPYGDLSIAFVSVNLSPDGTLAAVTEGALPDSVVTIYQNGTEVAAVTGAADGWIDDGRLLVNNYAYVGTQEFPSYINSTIYSSTGANLATVTLADAPSYFQTVTSDTYYDPAVNAIYSLTTGKATWTSPYPFITPSGGGWGGAVAGSYVVFESEGQVIAVPY